MNNGDTAASSNQVSKFAFIDQGNSAKKIHKADGWFTP
jgi:hypothetical protein